MPKKRLDIIVLISGSGSNLQALIDHSSDPDCRYRISAVISNQAAAFGLQRAAAAGIPQHCLENGEFADRASFDRAMQQKIDSYDPGLIVLAGFMRILTPFFVQHYLGRMLNIHPSLLPKYRGLHTHRRVLENGDREHGASVHFVTEELDDGPIVLQSRVPVLVNDTAESLTQRVQEQEHLIYPLVIDWYANGRVRLQKDRILFDGKPLTAPLLYQEIKNEKISGAI